MATVNLLGDDGRGYELARRLEGCGVWRAWLGDSSYSAFLHSLSSPAAWDAFMSSSSPSPTAQSQPQSHSQSLLHLQLRVRALLFDKASVSLYLHKNRASHSLNPNYLQLHGDDLFYSLEDEHHDQAQPRVQGPSNVRSRHGHEELPETWYSQYFEKLKPKYQKLTHRDKESLKRTSEGMSMYLKICEVHKRRRLAFKDEPPRMGSNGTMSNDSSDDEISFFPEVMFPSNCVPESSLPLGNETDKNKKVDVCGILDNLPTVVSRGTAMMERFGVNPDYIRVGSKYRGIDGSGREKKPVHQEQASQMTTKIVARLLMGAGFEGGTQSSMEVFSEFSGSHICRLGRILKLLTDSYKKQFSSIELLQMFLKTAGYDNLRDLIESTKGSNKGIITQTPQHVRMVQSQHHNSLLQAQAAQQVLQRQMHPQPQMSMLHQQTLTFQQQQQQLEKLRRRQATTPRGSAVTIDKDQQAMVDVKLENSMDSTSVDASSFNPLSKQVSMQYRHQQLQQQMAMANHHAAQAAQQQLRQLQPGQMTQHQMQNAYGMRAAPVKVEAFHELMGADSTMKHEPEHNKLTSPSK